MSRLTAEISTPSKNAALTRGFVGPVGLEPTTRGLKVVHRCAALSASTLKCCRPRYAETGQRPVSWLYLWLYGRVGDRFERRSALASSLAGRVNPIPYQIADELASFREGHVMLRRFARHAGVAGICST